MTHEQQPTPDTPSPLVIFGGGLCMFHYTEQALVVDGYQVPMEEDEARILRVLTMNMDSIVQRTTVYTLLWEGSPQEKHLTKTVRHLRHSMDMAYPTIGHRLTGVIRDHAAGYRVLSEWGESTYPQDRTIF